MSTPLAPPNPADTPRPDQAGPSGAEVSRRFHAEVVGPLIEREFPGLAYAAGRLGSGSDVLGHDDAMSRDHDWGCRLTVLVDDIDRAAIGQLNELLEYELPERFRGLPVRFPTTWSPAESHNVEVATATEFAASRLGIAAPTEPTVVDWLTLTGQSVLEVTAGPIFTDTTSELSAIRHSLTWYPPDIELYVLAAAWQRVIQQLPQIGRTAHRDQPLQSRLLSARVVEDLMRLGFLLHRQWAPYSKWRETAFRALPEADRLLPQLIDGANAADWEEREHAIVAGARILLQLQRERGLPTPEEGITPFWNRPYATVDATAPKLLLDAVADPAVGRLPAGVGSIEQWVDNVDILAHSARRAGAVAAYRSWLS